MNNETEQQLEAVILRVLGNLNIQANPTPPRSDIENENMETATSDAEDETATPNNDRYRELDEFTTDLVEQGYNLTATEFKRVIKGEPYYNHRVFKPLELKEKFLEDNKHRHTTLAKVTTFACAQIEHANRLTNKALHHLISLQEQDDFQLALDQAVNLVITTAGTAHQIQNDWITFIGENSNLPPDEMRNLQPHYGEEKLRTAFGDYAKSWAEYKKERPNWNGQGTSSS
ncbi:hypothetical protein LPJ72_001457 [Coemansia sp. Benny D160-2]|nr:hypothetical protein LPJ72_001457 [Coemansia sp. Benny D160-2]